MKLGSSLRKSACFCFLNYEEKICFSSGGDIPVKFDLLNTIQWDWDGFSWDLIYFLYLKTQRGKFFYLWVLPYYGKVVVIAIIQQRCCKGACQQNKSINVIFGSLTDGQTSKKLRTSSLFRKSVPPILQLFFFFYFFIIYFF